MRATTKLRVTVPLAMGSNVEKGVKDLPVMIDDIRYVADVDIRNVEKTQEHLMVNATARLTVHLPEPFDDDTTTTIQTVLATHDPVERWRRWQ